jgi:hypothetical protein
VTRRRTTHLSTAREEIIRFDAERDADLRAERRLLAWEVVILSGLVLVMAIVRYLSG